MQYNFHNEKYRMADIAGIKREQFREYAKDTQYRNNVDPERTGNNLYVEMVPGGRDWYGQIKEAQERTRETTSRAVRRDAVVLCSTIESVPGSWRPEICRKYFQDKAEWFGKYLHDRAGVDKDALKTLAVHLDESTPHATYAWIPIRDGRLQAKYVVDRDFLRDVQRDGQEFTLAWIDEWNEAHPENQIERLEPYVPDSRQQHLSESEFRQKKLDEKIQELSDLEEKERLVTDREHDIDDREDALIDRERDADIREKEIGEREKELDNQKRDFSDIITEAGERITDAWEQIGEERSVLEKSARRTEEARGYYEAQTAVYEDKLTELTEAPDMVSYDSLLAENESLREELSFRDRLIDSLQEEIEGWKELVRNLKESVDEWRERTEEWKERFQEFAEETGRRIAGYFGYEPEDQSISEYPSKTFSEIYDSIRDDISGIDPKTLRTIPDSEEDGTFRVVRHTDVGYETLRGGFDSRVEADLWRQDLAGAARDYDETLKEDRGLHR